MLTHRYQISFPYKRSSHAYLDIFFLHIRVIFVRWDFVINFHPCSFHSFRNWCRWKKVDDKHGCGFEMYLLWRSASRLMPSFLRMIWNGFFFSEESSSIMRLTFNSHMSSQPFLFSQISSSLSLLLVAKSLNGN